MSVKKAVKFQSNQIDSIFLSIYKMDSHSIFNYRTLFSALSSIFLFFSVLSFSSRMTFVPGAQKKQDLPRRQTPVFSKISVSAESIRVPDPAKHHPHIAGLAALVAPGEQVPTAGREVFLADARVARVAVRAGVDAGDDAGGDVVVFPDQCLAVGLGNRRYPSRKARKAVSSSQSSGLPSSWQTAVVMKHRPRNFLRKPPEMDS